MNNDSYRYMNTPWFPVLVGILAFFTLVFIHVQNDKLKSVRKQLDYYQKTYLTKSGATALWNGSKGEMLSYELRSLDGGISWYAVQRQGVHGEYVKVLGDVETVYPGLMKHLESFAALTERINKNGSLNLNDPSDLRFLTNVGFVVSTNK